MMELVDGVTQLKKSATEVSRESRKIEGLEKMLSATAGDIRILLIKLADRLHNMHTLHHISSEKQIRVATETLNIYAPLAARL